MSPIDGNGPLEGVLNLRSCHMAFSTTTDGTEAVVYLRNDSFRSNETAWRTSPAQHQRGYRCERPGLSIVVLPALRCLAIQKPGLTNPSWLDPGRSLMPTSPINRLT